MEDSEPFELDWLLKCNLEELIAFSPSDVCQELRANRQGYSRSRWRTNFRAVIGADCRNDDFEGRAWSADQLRRVLFCNS